MVSAPLTLSPSTLQISLHTCDGVQRVDVLSGLRTEEMSPQAVLKHHAQVLEPLG